MPDSAIGALFGAIPTPQSAGVPQTEVTLRHAGIDLARATLSPGEYVIGCAAEVEICAATPLLARRHALLTINFDHALLEDLGSEAGSFVAGERIAECVRLFPNQAIRLGEVELKIRRHRPPVSAETSLAPAQTAIRHFVPDEVQAELRYAIGSIVARGGMGAILDAEQAGMKRHVAMKVMLDSNEAADVARFVDEAQITGQLEHPNIVPVHELGVDENDQLFYTMKLVRGITLAKVFDLLAQGEPEAVKKYPLPALLTIFQKACDAIAFAHSKGVIHRDLKPENLMLGDFGEVLVMDWGLAKVVDGKPSGSDVSAVNRTLVASSRKAEPEFGSTMAGAIMGTPHYMAPEQARGEVETLDARADIYALGAILFQLLSLRRPVEGEDAWEIVARVAAGQTSPLLGTKKLPHLPGGRPPDSLAAVVHKAMALQRNARYASVEALQAEITAYQSGFATQAEKAGTWKQIQLLVRRHKAATIGAAAVLLVGATFGTKAVIEGRRAEREAVRAKAALADLKKTAPTMLALAESEAGFQRFDSALEKIDATRSLDPQLRSANWQRAWVLVGQQKFGEAAQAVRHAAQVDPANAALAAIEPVLDGLAAAPKQSRWTPDRTAALSKFLESVGAMGELAALSSELRLAARDKERLVRQRLVAWLGKVDGSAVSTDNQGLVVVELSGRPIDGLDPLRGLPIDKLWINHTHVASFEPLRGMQLRELSASGVNVSDLSPLAGLPLTHLTLSHAPVTDLRPLAGMQLTSVSIFNINADPTPLVGMPLEYLRVSQVPQLDLNAFAGSPIRELDIRDGLKDVSPLLKFRLLERLTTTTDAKHLQVLRGHPTLKLIAWGSYQLKPVAQFWVDFDAQQAAASPK